CLIVVPTLRSSVLVIVRLAGGLMVRFSDWAWFFWMNVPLGIIGMFCVGLFLHEKVEKQKRSIDYAGSGLFFISVSALMILFIEGGVNWDWLSLPTFRSEEHTSELQ